MEIRLMSKTQGRTADFFQKARKLQREGKLEEVIAVYRSAIKITPDFAWYYHNLGEALKLTDNWEEAIKCYQKAIEINPESAWFHYSLAETLTEQGKLDDAINYLQKAICLRDDIPVYHQALALAYESKSDFKQAFTTWQQIIAINPNHLIAAKNVHRLQQEQLDVDIDKIVPTIWCWLHQSLEFLSKNSPEFPEVLDRKEIFDFVNQNTNYKFIALDKLTDKDKNQLLENQISLDSFKYLFEDSDINEQNLIHNFIGLENHQLTKNPINSIRNFQKSIIETNYIYSICPETKKAIRSNLSFFIQLEQWPYILYRFEGKHTFYLIVGAWTGTKIAVYYPHSNLVIKVVNTLQGNNLVLEPLLNTLKVKIICNWKKYYCYCTNANPKKLAAIVNYTQHIGHAFMADYAGLQYLKSNQLLNSLDQLFVGEYNLVKIEKFFHEVDKSKIVYSHSEDLFCKSLTENSFLVRVTSYFISDELAERFKNYASLSCSNNIREEFSSFADCYPIIWINLRVNNRFWISQDIGLAKVIKQLQQNYPKLAVIFDGWTSLEEASLATHEKDFMEKQIVLVDKIQSLVPDMIFKSVIGDTVADKFEWLKLVDFYITPYGGGLIFPAVYNPPGIIYSSSGHTANNKISREFSNVRQNCISLPIIVSGDGTLNVNLMNSITNNTDLIKASPTAYSQNFECDPEKIYQECLSIIENLNS